MPLMYGVLAMPRYSLCCLILWVLAGCAEKADTTAVVQDASGKSAPTSRTDDSGGKDSGRCCVQDQLSKDSEHCCDKKKLAEIDKTLLTERQTKDRYLAADPDDPRFYPGRPHPVNYARWDLQRPEGELTHRLSDRFSNIELTTENGEKLRFYDDLVKDQIVVVSFFYTRCNGICAPTNRSLVQVRRALAKSLGKDIRLISISLDTEHDNPDQLKAYAKRFKDKAEESDPNLPEWFFLCGDEKEVNTLRREMGVYDLDPVIDADVTQHAGLLTYGNDRTNRWSALPSMLKPADITEGILRIAGNRFRDPKYAAGEIVSDTTWGIKGPLLAMQPWNRVLSVMDLKISIPGSLAIRGTEGISGRNLIDLIDSPKAESVRLLTPRSLQTAGTVIASGGTDSKGNLVADHCYMELARHVAAGKLELDKNSQPMINGIPIKENPDLRFPMHIVGVSGESISGEQLRSSVGHPASAEGYFHDGALYAVLLQVSAVPPLPHRGKAVQIHHSYFRDRSKHLRVQGTTTLTWVDSEVEIVDALNGRVLGRKLVRKPRGQKHGYFAIDINELKNKTRFVFARLKGDSETVRSGNTLVVNNDSISPLPTPGDFIVQGPVTALDPVNQTMTVSGMTVRIPDELLIRGTNHITGLTLNQLMDQQTTGAIRSLTAEGYNSGYLVRMSGQVSNSLTRESVDSPDTYTASSCEIDTSEVVLTGTLQSIDSACRQIVVNGLSIYLNSDSRFGFSFNDGTGNKIPDEKIPELRQSAIGRSVTVKGYSHLFQEKAKGTEYRPVQSRIVAVTVELSAPTQAVDRRSAPADKQEASKKSAKATGPGKNNA